MRKVSFYSLLTLAVFGMTLGLTLAFADQAHAIWLCDYECLYESSCQPNGPDCGGSDQLYMQAMCAGGPLNCSGESYWVSRFCCIDF